MKLLIETQYLPPVQTLARMMFHQNVVIEKYEHYVKATYRNRCHLATPNGVFKMSIPLKKREKSAKHYKRCPYFL